MGNVMHQSLTREEDKIIVPGKNPIEYDMKLPQIQYAEPPVSKDVGNVVALYTPRPVENKENANSDIIPFEPNFNDQDVPDIDLLEILKQVEEASRNVEIAKQNTTLTMTAMTANNVLNNIPKSLFHNCTIQNITFNMPK